MFHHVHSVAKFWRSHLQLKEIIFFKLSYPQGCPKINRHDFGDNVIPSVSYCAFTNSTNLPDMNSLECKQGSHVSSETRDHQSVRLTPDIEKKYVHSVYDAIAPHFSSTRFAKWPKVAGFINSLKPGSVILDVGCGNGKYLGLNPDCLYVGCDISPPLIDICARRGHEVIVADAVNLPYRNSFGDAAISIAVLHHLSTESRRRKAIEELVRVVRKGGLVLITVWAVEQEDKSLLMKWTPLCHKYNEEWISPSSVPTRNHSTVMLESIPEADENSHHHGNQSNKSQTQSNGEEAHQEYFVPWHLPFHRAEIGGATASAIENGLAKKDNKKGAMVYNRYYHVFAEGELARLVSGMDNAAIVGQFYDKSNWCIVLEKR
ncbi:hypothetical protein J5N97_028356 [Dioscorea zingiberensis]|uniref:Methyltransferase type 11 domain-containing protein n=1 Tax=Dioscorea zingiberensis TaxID=325984 RepID=A0A9D5BYX7_9LILI|nr:hypothetical protein J5N97_028356 [Dioscorea zingiberensis]